MKLELLICSFNIYQVILIYLLLLLLYIHSDKITKKSTYKKKLSLALSIKSLLTPVFQDLSKDELLHKCLHGQTQNKNELLNNVIWKKCPKTMFVSKKVLESSVFSAIIEFNDRVIGQESVYIEFGIPYNFLN